MHTGASHFLCGVLNIQTDTAHSNPQQPTPTNQQPRKPPASKSTTIQTTRRWFERFVADVSVLRVCVSALPCLPSPLTQPPKFGFLSTQRKLETEKLLVLCQSSGSHSNQSSCAFSDLYPFRLCLSNIEVLVDHKQPDQTSRKIASNFQQEAVDTEKLFPQLSASINEGAAVLLFPGETALPLQDYRPYTSNTQTRAESVPGQNEKTQSATHSDFGQHREIEHIILLDGTWSQATGLLNRHPILNKVRRAVLPDLG